MDNYELKDLYLSSLLYSEGIKFIGINKRNNVCWFVFEDKKKCEEIIQLYWKNELTGKIKAFTDAIRTLKDMIYSQ